MARFIDVSPAEMDYRSVGFTYAGSDPLWNGWLFHLDDLVGVIFVAQKRNPNTGCREPLTVEGNEDGVLVYSCEKIRVLKAEGSGTAWTVGQAVYWDGIAGNPVTQAWQTGFLWIGMCVKDAADDDETVLIDLHGNHPLAEQAP